MKAMTDTAERQVDTFRSMASLTFDVVRQSWPANDPLLEGWGLDVRFSLRPFPSDYSITITVSHGGQRHLTRKHFVGEELLYFFCGNGAYARSLGQQLSDDLRAVVERAEVEARVRGKG